MLAAAAAFGMLASVWWDEVEAVGRLGGLVAEEVADWAEQHQRFLAGRAFALVGPVAAPVRAVHDVVLDVAYGGVRAVTRMASQGLGAGPPSLSTAAAVLASPVGGQAVAALDAILGDWLEEAASPLALPMAVRVAQADVGISRAGLDAAFPGATARVVLFVHGLGQTDLSWLGTDDAGGPWSYALALAPAGWTGAFVRYNSGRHIGANGASLACLLEEVVDAWPMPVADLALVGHSLGGLVIRSACAHGAAAGHVWPGLVRSCVYLGSPHDGAPLEQGLNVVARALGRLPDASAVAAVLRLRSAGIKDLGQGTLVGDGRPAAGFEDVRADLGRGPELLASARHYLVAGHLGPGGCRPAAFLDDLLVRERSALGLGHDGTAALEPVERLTIPATSHYALLKDQRVADALFRWLG